MYHVVIGVDEEEAHALACAREVANLPGEGSEKRVTLVHSISEDTSGVSAAQIRPVSEVGDYLESYGIDYEVAESSGDPADAIVEAADEANADLTVVGGGKHSPAGETIPGSVTQSVVTNAGRSVLVVDTEINSDKDEDIDPAAT